MECISRLIFHPAFAKFSIHRFMKVNNRIVVTISDMYIIGSASLLT